MKTGPQPSEEFRVITQFSGVLNSIFAVGWTVWSLIPGGASFTVPVRADIGVTSPPLHCVPGLFPGGKAAWEWR